MKKYISLMVFALALIGCQNSFDDYYSNEDRDVMATKSILTYLSEDPDYAYFVDVLKSSGVADTMDSRYLYTVFAPKEADLKAAGIETMSADSVALYMKMHICANLKLTSVLDQYNRLQMFSDKYLDIQKDSVTLKYTADGVDMIETNIRCTDGIVHKLDGVLTPRLNIYEWLMAAGDDFSTFRDELLSRSKYSIDWDKSEMIGEDEYGRPIFDTVYSVSNEILNRGNIQNDKALYRVVIPTNDAIKAAFDDMGDTYTVRGMSVSKADSTKWMDWIMKAAIYDYSQSGIESFDDIVGEADYSVFNLEFRPSTVTLKEPLRLSNGFVAVATKAYLPAYIPMTKITVNPYDIRYHYCTTHANYKAASGVNADANQGLRIFNDNAGFDWWNQDLKGWADSKFDTARRLATLGFNGTFASNYGSGFESRYAYSFRTFTKGTKVVDDVSSPALFLQNVVPGNYSLSVQMPLSTVPAGVLTDLADIYVNDTHVDRIDSISKNNYAVATKIGAEDYFYIGDSINPVTFKVEIWSPTLPPMNLPSMVGNYTAICVGNFVLTPVNNY